MFIRSYRFQEAVRIARTRQKASRMIRRDILERPRARLLKDDGNLGDAIPITLAGVGYLNLEGKALAPHPIQAQPLQSLAMKALEPGGGVFYL